MFVAVSQNTHLRVEAPEAEPFDESAIFSSKDNIKHN